MGFNGGRHSSSFCEDDIFSLDETWLSREMPFAFCRTTKLKGVLLKRVPRRAKNFLKWRICPTTDKLEIPRKLVTFQMRRTLGTDLQNHGTIKDAQETSRHATIKTTADVYMQEIPASVRAAINSRTRAVLGSSKRLSQNSGV